MKNKPKGEWSANEATDFAKHCLLKSGKNNGYYVTSNFSRYCAVAGMLGHGSASAPSVAITQVFENHQGKSVPASCE